MKILKFIFAIFVFLLYADCATAQTKSQQETIASLHTDLRIAKTAKDSLSILYDIFDLSPRKDYKILADQIFRTAEHAGDLKSQLDISRLVTSALSEDDDYAALEEKVSQMPESDEQKETLLFVRMKRISHKSKNLPEDKRQKEITSILAEYDNDVVADKYDRMLQLYTLVAYLRNNVSGDMLKKYLDELYTLANSPQFSLYAISNLIYAETANAYTAARDHQKAVEADRKLLDVITALEEKYKKRGRAYRNYDISRYVCYRRMLCNFEGLAPGEAQSLNQKIQKLAQSNTEVRNDLDNNPHAIAFYLMATGNYNEAIPALKSLYIQAKALSLKRRALELLVNASEHTGDKETQLEALKLYNRILLESSKLGAAERYREMQIRYDINELERKNNSLTVEANEKKISETRRIMSLVIVAFVILAIAFVISIFYWARFRRNSFMIGLIANKLGKEKNQLRHNVFNEYDDSPDEPDIDFTKSRWGVSYDKNKCKDLDEASFITQCIVNDLMEIAFHGHDNRMKCVQPTSVDSIMRRAFTKVNEIPGFAGRISVEYPQDDFKITTDADALVLIVAHLMRDLADTNGSSASLECRIAPDGFLQFLFTSDFDWRESGRLRSFSPIITAKQMAEQEHVGILIDRIITLLMCSDLKENDLKENKRRKGGRQLIFTTPTDICVKP